jgi:hypothetical protein
MNYNPHTGTFDHPLDQGKVIKKLFDEYSGLKIPLKRTLSDSDSFDKPRNAKGLKILSARVKSILMGKKLGSYRQVAQELIKDLNIVNKAEEKNILRRVYDALNVLIAAGVVVKQGKDYCWKSLSKENQVTLKCKELKITGKCLSESLSSRILTISSNSSSQVLIEKFEAKVCLKFSESVNVLGHSV